jgi:peptide deformylase
MAIQRVSQVGERVIRSKAKKVSSKDRAAVGVLINDLIDTMHATDLIGIAAPQIGVSAQVFVTEIRKTKVRKRAAEADDLRVFINPTITWLSKKETAMDEGCGSVCHATLFGQVKRPAEVEVQALDEHFQPFTMRAKGLLAKCLQHEYDHLQGVVILDKFTDTRKCWVRESK